MPPNKLIDLLRTLNESAVESVLVGGLSAVLNGAPINSFDVDIVHAHSAANVNRLLAALESLDAVFRMQPERRLRPNASHLVGPEHLSLLTRFGPLAVLGEIGQQLSYEELRAHAAPMKIATDLQVRVLDLETLIRLKEELGGAKDIAVLGLLRQTLQESRKVQAGAVSSLAAPFVQFRPIEFPAT